MTNTRYEIRCAEEDDLPQIHHVDLVVFGDHAYGPHALRQFLVVSFDSECGWLLSMAIYSSLIGDGELRATSSGP